MIATSGSAIGYFTGQYPAATATATERIGFEYVRLRYTQGTAGPSIVSAGINVFEA